MAVNVLASVSEINAERERIILDEACSAYAMQDGSQCLKNTLGIRV